MITHNGVGIWLKEQTGYDEGDFTVSRTNGLIYKAESVYGKSYALSPEAAVEGARRQIDNASKRG